MTTTAKDAQLAIDGGPKAVAKMTGKPQPKVGVAEFLSIAQRFGFNEAALARIRNAVSDADLGAGPHLGRYYGSPGPAKNAQFEALAREKFGVKYALGVSSGTAALHAAMIAAGVGPGAEVIVAATGFYATAASVVLSGGVPIFCDIDESMQIDPRQIERHITPRTVAVAPTHSGGSVADMGPVKEIARRHGLKVIEDCAQAPGGKYRGRYVGAIGDLGCYSISCYKIIGGGEGGMVVTNDQLLFDRANQLAECGGLWRPDRFAAPRYDGELFNGTNYRLSELEAAVDLVQLGKLDDVVRRHHAVKQRVCRQLKSFTQITPQKLNDVEGEIGYALRFYPQTLELSKKVATALRAEGIGAYCHAEAGRPDWHQYSDMFPIMLRSGPTPGCSPWEDPRYVARGGKATYERGDCPVADDLVARSVIIGLSQWSSPQDCDAIAAGINKVLGAYCPEGAEGAEGAAIRPWW